MFWIEPIADPLYQADNVHQLRFGQENKREHDDGRIAGKMQISFRGLVLNGQADIFDFIVFRLIKVSAVFWNRLNHPEAQNTPNLGSDPTVHYADMLEKQGYTKFATFKDNEVLVK